jgi:hypothetical protein
MNSGPSLKRMYTERVRTSLQSNSWENLSGFWRPTYSGWARLAFDYIYAKDLSALDVTIDSLPHPVPNRHQGSDHTAVACRIQNPLPRIAQPQRLVDSAGMSERQRGGGESQPRQTKQTNKGPDGRTPRGP